MPVFVMVVCVLTLIESWGNCIQYFPQLASSKEDTLTFLGPAS